MELPGAGPESDLVLDLLASSPLRPAFYYDTLYLRSGVDFYPLLDSTSPEDLDPLESLSAAEVASLVIQDAGSVLTPGVQPSLVFIVCKDQDDCFWNSIPVLY